VYVFLDKIYYAPEGNIKSTDITPQVPQREITPNVVLNSYNKNILLSLSDDLSYTAYISDGHVNVLNTNTGKATGNLTYSSGVQCLAYTWIPNSDVVIIAEKINGKQIKFYSYDAEKQTKVEIGNGKDSVPAGKNVTVDMKISDETGLLYVKVGYSETLDRIYRIDRNETLTRVVATNVGTIALDYDDDQLAYEDLVYDTIRTDYTPKPRIAISGVYKPGLIGSDENDNFYVGNGIEQSSKVYYGKLTENTSSWKNISLGTMIKNNSIVVTQNGNLYIVDRENSKVTDVKSNKSYSYEGDFWQIDDGYIVYTDGGKLMIKKM
jgi:hypothetical protein